MSVCCTRMMYHCDYCLIKSFGHFDGEVFDLIAMYQSRKYEMNGVRYCSELVMDCFL